MTHRRHTRSSHFWFSVAIAVLAGVAVFFLASDFFRFSESSNTVVPSTKPTRYTDAEFPIAVTVPKGWEATRNESGVGDGRVVNVVFGDDTNGVTMIIAQKTLLPVIRKSAGVADEQSVMMNGLSAVRLPGQSARDGGRFDLLIFEKDDRVYVLNGQADFVDTLAQTFTFIE